MPSATDSPKYLDNRDQQVAETCHKKGHSAPMRAPGASFNMLYSSSRKVAVSDELVTKL